VETFQAARYLDVHAICDDHRNHKTKEVQAWLAKHPDQATAPLLDEAILSCGEADQRQLSDTKPTPAHGRGAAHRVRELAHRVGRLASMTKN
jgi:hypothetical protein